MPVSDENATRQFFVEALRQNTDTLKSIREDSREDRKLLHDIHARVIKIESNRMENDVERIGKLVIENGKRLTALETDKNRRDGAMSGVDWLFKNWPGVIAFFAVIVVILESTGRI